MAVTNFIWDVENDSYLMETDGSGQTQAAYTNEPTQYGRLISEQRDTATHYYHSDVVGSTRQLTDANEATTDSYDYTAFGESVAQSGSTTNPFRYWGEFGGYSDAELANEVYIRRRHYLTSEGRWGSVDPLGFVDGTNLYQFAGNNPVLLGDASGTVIVANHASGSRRVCCKLERGWIIKETFSREIRCSQGQSAYRCCKDWASGWYRVLFATDAPCPNNPLQNAALSTTAVGATVAIPTDPSDVVGTPVGGAVAAGGAIVAALATIEGIRISWPRIRPRGRPRKKKYGCSEIECSLQVGCGELWDEWTRTCQWIGALCKCGASLT